MGKGIRKVMQISAIISGILLITVIISVIHLVKDYPSLHPRIIMYIIIGISVLLILIWTVSLKLAEAYRIGKSEGLSIYVIKTGINILLPVYICLIGLFKGDKDDIRRLYISVNNIVVRHDLKKNNLSKTLMLLPSCMQNKDCNCKITENIKNCRRCGGCRIGEVASLTERGDVRTIVVKGGTAARNLVKEFKPDFILAVACERELISGMGDVGGIPVIGIINQRPNGYCTNTTVDMMQLTETLQELS